MASAMCKPHKAPATFEHMQSIIASNLIIHKHNYNSNIYIYIYHTISNHSFLITAQDICEDVEGKPAAGHMSHALPSLSLSFWGLLHEAGNVSI